MREADEDGDGKLDYKEFKTIIKVTLFFSSKTWAMGYDDFNLIAHSIYAAKVDKVLEENSV